MHRWMMWALMGTVVTALVLAGCDNGDDDDSTFEVTCINELTTGQIVDVHIVKGADGSSPDIENRTPEIQGLALGGDAGNAKMNGEGNWVVIFVLAGTDQVLGRGYFGSTGDSNFTATLTGDGSGPGTVEVTEEYK